MTQQPYQEWAAIRKWHPGRSVNSCLIFTDQIQSIPIPNTMDALRELQAVDGACIPSEILAQITAPKTALESMNSRRWIHAAFHQTASFQYRLRYILGDWHPMPPLIDVLMRACYLADHLQGPLTPARINNLLRRVGYDEDVEQAVLQLYDESLGKPYVHSHKVLARSTYTHLLIISLWLKDLDSGLESISAPYPYPLVA